MNKVKCRFRCYFFNHCRYDWLIADGSSFTYPTGTFPFQTFLCQSSFYILRLYSGCSLNGLRHRACQQFDPWLIDWMKSHQAQNWLSFIMYHVTTKTNQDQRTLGPSWEGFKDQIISYFQMRQVNGERTNSWGQDMANKHEKFNSEVWIRS